MVFVEELREPGAGVGGVLETAGVAGVELEGFELALAEGVVVADAWPGIAGVDAELGEEVSEAVCGHRCAAVLVNDERVRLDAMAGQGVAEQVLGEPGILFALDHPADVDAAVEVEVTTRNSAIRRYWRAGGLGRLASCSAPRPCLNPQRPTNPWSRVGHDGYFAIQADGFSGRVLY